MNQKTNEIDDVQRLSASCTLKMNWDQAAAGLEEISKSSILTKREVERLERLREQLQSLRQDVGDRLSQPGIVFCQK
jgi:hypothetical protein